MEIKNVNGLWKNISTDFFGGAMTFQYPFVFPSGSRGMTPSLSLSYASNNTDAFSPYGYGFSVSLPRVQRSAKKWVSELYIGNEYSAFGSDLLLEPGSSSRYRSKDGNDMNLYIQSGSNWIVQTPEGKNLIFGATTKSRIADPMDPKKIYAWLLNEENDAFGHRIRYAYFQDGWQSYISDILYGYDTTGDNPLYQIHFDYIDKWASLTSYRTQFEISTKKVLSHVTLKVDGKAMHTYTLSYDNLDTPISHLMSISESAGSVTLPKIQFSYGSGQLQHLITGIDNARWGKATFEYSPSTGYRDNSGTLLNEHLPFMVMTLSKQILEDGVTGIRSKEAYSYSWGHYYYDPSDLWGREYVGFGQVTVSDEKTKKILYFHQSQTAVSNALKYQDHISKKWRIYRTDVIDSISGKIVQEELIQYDARVLFWDRRLIVPIQKISTEFDLNGAHRDTASTYEYDTDGNLIGETQFGLVQANLSDGTFRDIPGDTIRIERSYAANPAKNLYRFPVSEKLYGFSGELLSASSVEYDGMSSGVVLWLLTMKKKQDIENGNSVSVESFLYSPTGLPIERIDALWNTTISTYDTRDIALLRSKNTMNWQTTYIYDYTIGKVTQMTDPNQVISMVSYDGFGRMLEQKQDIGSGAMLLTRMSYDDLHIPNNTTTIQYFDTTSSDSKITKSYRDGWERTIATISTTEKPWQYSASQIRYDDDGNPIYAGYPVFVHSDIFDTSLVLSGVTDGERYRANSPGVSYMYDSLDRIVAQRDARWTTKKSYILGWEIITNALWYTTEAHYDAYKNLSSFIEYGEQMKNITTYDYDGLRRPVRLTDTNNNIRTWDYDGFGRLSSASDLHGVWDTTFGIRQYSYDLLGRIEQYTNPNHASITYQYDPLSRIIQELYHTDSGAMLREYQYDLGIRSLGTLSYVWDAMSSVEYEYDPLGRKITETRTIGGTTYELGYVYNTASLLTDIRYPDGGNTHYDYRNGYIEWVKYMQPSGLSTQIISDVSYAPNATMQSIRYGNGVVKNIERDSDNNYRLIRATATALDGTKLLDTNYSYDAISDIISIAENGIQPLRKQVNYTYDSLARLTNASYSYSIMGYWHESYKDFSYQYDAIGNIMSATDVGNYTYAGTNFANPHAVTRAGDIEYEYDRAGNTISRSSLADVLSFSYSPYGEMLSSIKNGVVTNYAYDASHRRILKSTRWLIEHHVIDGYEIEYESGVLIPVNYEPVIHSTTGATDSGELLTNIPTIDSGSIVIDATGSNTGSTGHSFIDGSGEILVDSGALPSEIQETSAILIDTGIVASGSVDTGSASLDSGSTDMSPSTSSGDMLSFSWESTDSGSYVVIASYSAMSQSGATPVTLVTTLTHIYLWDEKIATFQSQTDDTPKTPDNDQLIFHISDHLNSSSLDLSSTGMILQATDYQPFGKTITYQVTNQRIPGRKWGYNNKYLFANKQLDGESDLQYFEKRYYDPRIGRFTTEDPVFWEVGITKRPSQYFTDPQQWNSYSYVRNNPINMTDPTGEMSWNNLNPFYIESAYSPSVEDINTPPVDINASWNTFSSFIPIWWWVFKNLGKEIIKDGTKVVTTVENYVLKNASKVPKPDVSKITNTKLANIVKDNYRPTSTIWNQSAADAIRYTKQTGQLVWWSDHLKKWQDTINGLQNLIKKSTLNMFDTKVAKSILNDVKNALSWK